MKERGGKNRTDNTVRVTIGKVGINVQSTSTLFKAQENICFYYSVVIQEKQNNSKVLQ